jgi:thiamine kinase-like enzyme
VCPVDWEMAGIGPGALDLAALLSGNWTDGARLAMCCAYLQGRAGEGSWDLSELVEIVKWARLQLSLQWLGWAPGWLPPPEHRRDWLGEALKLAEELGL